ncbi:MAG: hypothetical protein MUE53_06480 [Chitinophagales bacterium]|jgi:hypothetical protein|nr:hypothetical protein [Chitinophagales bacterium]
MISSSIVEIYLNLLDTELKSLDKYIHTSEWQNSSIIVEIHAYFYALKKKNQLENSNKEDLYRILYGKAPYNDSKLRFNLNRLTQAIKQWHLIEKAEENHPLTQKIWMDYLSEKKLKKNSNFQLKQPTAAAISSEYKYLDLYFRSQLSAAYILRYQKDYANQYKAILEIIESSQIFADLTFLRNYCSVINLSQIYRASDLEIPVERLEAIKHKYSQTDYLEFKLYISLLDMLLYREEQQYYDYKALLLKHIFEINDVEKVGFINYLINYTISKTNSGNQDFLKERFEIYQFLEAQNLFVLPGFVDYRTINNVILIALRMKEITWAERFLQRHIESIENEEKETCLHYNLARILFEQKQYKESLYHLLLVDFSEDVFYAPNSKMLLLKTYFEIREYESFISLTKSFKQLVKLNKVLSDLHKTAYINFILFAKKLFQASKNKKKLIALEISETKTLVEKQWLLEKANA